MASEKPFSEINGSEIDRLIYASSYHLVKGVGRVALGLEISGAENIPKSGRAIFASNHRHWLDIFMSPISIPDRHLAMVAKKEIFNTPIMSRLFERWGAISIDRQAPGPSTTREVISRLKDEKLVGVMPEGTRNKGDELGEMLAGVARWARLGNAITFPAYIGGADSLLGAIIHRSVSVNIGQPISPPASRDDEQAFMAELRDRIQSLNPSLSS